MGYWFFMLAMNLLLPAIMIISGGYFMKKAPKEINYVFLHPHRSHLNGKGKGKGKTATKNGARMGAVSAFTKIVRLSYTRCLFWCFPSPR